MGAEKEGLIKMIPEVTTFAKQITHFRVTCPGNNTICFFSFSTVYFEIRVGTFLRKGAQISALRSEAAIERGVLPCPS